MSGVVVLNQVSAELIDGYSNGIAKQDGYTLTPFSTGFPVLGRDDNDIAKFLKVDGYGVLKVDGSGSTQPVSGSGVFDVNITNDLIVVNTSPTNDAFSQNVTSSRYNQIEIAFDQTDPDLIADITVTKTNGGDASNSVGQAVFTSGTNTSGGVKAVSNTSISYRPHAEVYAAFTAIFTAGIANSYQRIGLYDTNNGFFIGYNETTFGITIRKGGVDTFTARSSFSEDTLLGESTSQYTRNASPEVLDLQKDNLYRIRFGWLGAAPIVFEVLSPDGNWVTFHKIKHPNTTAGTSINNPDLPLTLEIQKTTAGSTALVMNTACWAAGTTSDLQKVSSAVTDNSLVKFMRAVLTAKKPNGEYTNIQATAGGNLKVSVEEFDPAVFGQETMANSLPVVIASNQTAIPVNDNSGSLTIDNIYLDGYISTLATSANQINGNQKTQIVDGANVLDINASGQAAIQNQPNMDVALSTRLAESTFTARIGEVQTTPTANTVLGRLKDIEDEIIARLGTLGQKTMDSSSPVVLASDQTVIPVNDNGGSLTVDNAYIDGYISTLATSANQTNGDQKTQIVDGVNILDINSSGQAAIQNQPNMDVALSTRVAENTFTARMGEVQTTPTANTVLGRLKDVEDELIARLGTLGQKTMADSTPVVIANDQTVIPVNDNNGSLTIDSIYIDGYLSTLATSANQINGNQKTQIVDGVNILDINSSGQAAIQNQPNMDVALSTRLAENTFTARVGEVQTTPTANTVLGRLKDVHDTTLTLLTELEFETRVGEVQTTPTANTILGRLKNIHDTTLTLLTELEFETRIGEVQANPTANTVLGRLKDIEDELIARLGTLGQKTMTNSTPVVIASNQSEYPVVQGTSAPLLGAWPVKVTDGYNTLPTMDVQERAGFTKITDGYNTVVAVKPASTAAQTTDTSLVVALSPNTQLPAGSNLVGGTRLYDYNDTSIRATTSQELRVAQLYVLGEFNSRYTLETYHWDTLTATGGTATHVPAKAAIEIAATAASGSSATLRTNTYFKYQCGFSQLCGMTLLHSDTGSANQVREWGYYDGYNGYFFKLSGTALSIVRRSSVSGSPVDIEYPQASWSVDPLNGTGKSGITLDVSKGNGYEIEAQCFGVGLIRFFIGGILVHQLRFSNTLNDPAMQTISLPIQVRVSNTGASAIGSITLLTARVVAEGLTHDPLSRVYGVTNPTDIEVGLTERPILSVRPKLTFNNIFNRSWLLPIFAQISTQGYKVSYKIILNATLTGASWTSVNAESTAEYDISSTSYSGGEVIYSHFIPLDDDTDDAQLETFFDIFGRKLRNPGFLGTGSNIVDTITIVATNEAVGKTDVRASMSWKEVRV